MIYDRDEMGGTNRLLSVLLTYTTGLLRPWNTVIRAAARTRVPLDPDHVIVAPRLAYSGCGRITR